MCQRLPGSLPGRGKFGGPRYKRSGMVTGITRATRVLLRR